MRRTASVLCAAAMLASAGAASAQTYSLGVLGSSNDSTFLPGMTEVFARIENTTPIPIQGELIAKDRGDPSGSPLAGHAGFSVAAGSTAIVKMPANAEKYALSLELQTAAGIVSSKTFGADSEMGIRVFDIADPSRVRPMIEGVSVQSTYTATPYGPGGVPLKVRVGAAFVDPTSGSFVLPSFVTSWQGTHLVIAPARVLAQLPPDELQALYGFVLAGGTLAISVSKPEELRDETLVTLIGDTPEKISPPDPCFEHFEVPLLKTDMPRFSDVTDRPPELVRFVSYSGGNLTPTVFGATAKYGLGEVVLLGFDPNEPDVAKEPWAALRLTDLGRRAYERFQRSIVRPGFRSGLAGPSGPRPPPGRIEPVGALLDPNTAARWSIGVASLLICGYAIVAGPVNFARAKKRNRPLQALLALPLLSIIAFLVVVVFGFLSKGVSRRSNRLTLIDVGAGMDQGASKRYRAFFSPFSQAVEVRPGGRSNMLEVSNDESSDRVYTVDGDGLRMGNIESMPAQTVIVREEGVTPLGGSVDITPGSEDNFVITNRLSHALRGLVVHLADDTFRYHAKLAVGASVASEDLGPGNSSFKLWTTQMRGRGTTPPLQMLNAWDLKLALAGAGESDLGEAWLALEGTAPPRAEWFPSGVPVVLALVEGGSGDKRDSGVAVDHDWFVVRVVGMGGQGP